MRVRIMLNNMSTYVILKTVFIMQNILTYVYMDSCSQVNGYILTCVCGHSNRHVHVNIKFSSNSAFTTPTTSDQPPVANRQPSTAAEEAAAAAVDINNPHRSKQPTFKCKRLWRMALASSVCVSLFSAYSAAHNSLSK